MRHYQFGSETFTAQQRLDVTAKSIEGFKRMYPEFYPCEANAEKLLAFVISQLGNNEGDAPTYPLPYTTENFASAYRAVLSSGGWFIERPESEEVIEAREQEQRDAEAAQREAEDQPRRDAAWQLKAYQTISTPALRAMAARERPSGGGEKHVSQAQPGDESRRLGYGDVSARAAARARVILANPFVKRDSQKFNELVAEELQK